MDERKLKLLIENELYSLVLAYSQDELAKINYNTVRKAINQFIGKYKKELTKRGVIKTIGTNIKTYTKLTYNKKG